MSTRQILIAVDNSQCADYALEYYVTKLYKQGESVILMYVIPNPRLPSFSTQTPMSFPAGEWKNIMTKHNEENEAVEKKYNKILLDNNLKGKSKFVTANVGSSSTALVGEKICDYVKTNGIDMVVVGSRGLGKVRRTILGSTSDYVLHHLEVPVIVVPRKEAK